ncbi:MAG TPA: hypothetical protein VHI52_07340 [Verrucomicrobiae bacterium]|nr:hypothetical protein [Verrucomicrobiae bacterium]
MNAWKYAVLAVAACFGFTAAATAPTAQAQISINIGPPPDCPYGYYAEPPYNCAPYGYYGPEWFNGGVFIGAGRWFHGPAGFHGYVDHRFDPHYGYHGPFPHRGEHPDHHIDAGHFHGHDMHDGHGGEYHGHR